METINTTEMWSYFDGAGSAKKATNRDVRNGPGHKVRSFMELATKVAELQFRNLESVLMFRGQEKDYRNTEHESTIKPTLFRPIDLRNPGQYDRDERFKELICAEKHLVSLYEDADFNGIERLKRYRLLRWSILQHYEVCRTPLLDVTHSLRIAASFASIRATDGAFLFVFGVPNVSGAITASAEAGLQIVRLSSVCPPSAVRPHIQEGYLLGEFPEIADTDQKELYAHFEVDFGRRLLAKFRFEPTEFWKRDDFPKVKKSALYPSEDEDPLYKVALAVKAAIEN